MLELKIKCPSDILTEYSNSKTRIFFEFKPEHNKYTLIKKTREFFLDENKTFTKEYIHFFNISKTQSSIYIFLEIEGKKIKPENNKENYYKLSLNEIKDEKKEITCLIVENVELKILIRIINKSEKNKINSININKEEISNTNIRKRIYTQYNGCNNFNKPGLSIQDRIKIFNGEFIKKNIYKNQNIPGKLKIPDIFLQNGKQSNSSKEKESKDIKENDKNE